MEADVTQKAKQIKTDSFFLIHGLADVTAPYHHSLQLARSLTEAGTIFRYQVSCVEEFKNNKLMNYKFQIISGVC